MTLPASRPSVAKTLQNHLRRIRALEALVSMSSLIATNTFCWGSTPGANSDNNPVLMTGALPITLTLVAVSVANVNGADGLNVYIYDEQDVDVDVGAEPPVWVVPGPAELGAVPFVPIKFVQGLVAAVVVAATDALVDPDDYPGLKVTFAWKA